MSRARFIPALLVAIACGSLATTGCTSVACKAVPANRLPAWMLSRPRANNEPINFIMLRQDPPAVYQLGPRDILGVYIQGVLGNEDEAPPFHFPQEGDTPPAIGFPIPIREDGTLALPLIPALKVSGLTLTQAENEIRREYLDRGILVPGRDRIIVTLIRKRTYQVLVIREDQGSAQLVNPTLLAGPSKRGSAMAVDLEAYNNDVLHALTETGGLPGLDAKNEITVLRGAFVDAQGRNAIISEMLRSGYLGPDGVPVGNPNVIRIPLRVGATEPAPQLKQEDIILQTGDIVFIESREREVFYSGGLLNGREIVLPRDFDLDVVQAVAVAGGAVSAAAGSGVQGRSFGGGGGAQGLIPPTQVIIIRRLDNRIIAENLGYPPALRPAPGNSTSIAISVNLNRALLNQRERILVQPGDMVLLEYTPIELVGNIILGNVTFTYFLNQLQQN